MSISTPNKRKPAMSLVHLVKFFGFGVAMNRPRIDVDVERDDGDVVAVDYLLEGPSFFITFLVPGLK